VANFAQDQIARFRAGRQQQPRLGRRVASVNSRPVGRPMEPVPGGVPGDVTKPDITDRGIGAFTGRPSQPIGTKPRIFPPPMGPSIGGFAPSALDRQTSGRPMEPWGGGPGGGDGGPVASPEMPPASPAFPMPGSEFKPQPSADLFTKPEYDPGTYTKPPMTKPRPTPGGPALPDDYYTY